MIILVQFQKWDTSLVGHVVLVASEAGKCSLAGQLWAQLQCITMEEGESGGE